MDRFDQWCCRSLCDRRLHLRHKEKKKVESVTVRELVKAVDVWSVEIITVGIRRWRSGGGEGGEEREGKEEEDDGGHVFVFGRSGEGVLGHDAGLRGEIWRVKKRKGGE